MNPNAVRGAIAVLVVAAVIGAYQLGKGAGKRDAGVPSGQANSQVRDGAGPGTGLGSMLGSASSTDGGEASEAGGMRGKSVKSIIAKARAKMQGGMMNPSGAMRAVALLDQLTDEQLTEALEEIERIREPQQRMMFAMLLLGRWAETDGPGALAYAAEHFDSKNPMMMGVKSSVLSAWAQNDPEAAWDHFLKSEDEGNGRGFGGRGMSLMGIFGSLATKDVDKAFERLAQLDDEGERQMAMQGLGQAIWNEDRREEILAKVATLEDGERQMAQSSILGQWSMMDPDGALEWAGGLPGEEGPAAIRQIGNSLAWSDPQRAGEILLSQAQSADEREQAYNTAVSTWSGNDPKAASAWLAEQPQGPELDAARSSLANNIAGREPDSAMQWANSVTDSNQRYQAIRSVYAQWRSRDEAAASSSLDGVDITPEQRAELRAMEEANRAEASFDPSGTRVRSVRDVREEVIEVESGADTMPFAEP